MCGSLWTYDFNRWFWPLAGMKQAGLDMFDNISPGSTVSVKIVKQPRSTAATKTLIRVLSKDPLVQAQNKLLCKIRKQQYAPARRGGRLYGGRMIKIKPFKIEVGLSKTIKATLDVITDLQSVKRFIEVSSV